MKISLSQLMRMIMELVDILKMHYQDFQIQQIIQAEFRDAILNGMSPMLIRVKDSNWRKILLKKNF